LKIEFDAVKDLLNRDKHGASLADAAQLDWNTLVAKRDTRRDYGETREIGYGIWNRRLYCVVFTRRARGVFRIISLRKADTREVNAYEEIQSRKTHGP
jgi:uncharacterized DUF497 family protein